MEKIIEIIVKPNSPKTEIKKEEGSLIYLNVKAPPQEGKANLEIIKFFSKKYKGSLVQIIKGLKSKRKIIKITKI